MNLMGNALDFAPFLHKMSALDKWDELLVSCTCGDGAEEITALNGKRNEMRV